MDMSRKVNKSTERDSQEDEFDRVKMGKRLREVRQYINLPQEIVAHHVGIPWTALSQIESGRRKVDALELKKIAELYKYPVAYFTGETSIVTEATEDIAELIRSATNLSEHDRTELSRFADYLNARSQTLRPEND